MPFYIAGVDEVGRGPLAGPLITAAVIMSKPLNGVTDSKKLSANKRAVLASLIKEQACSYAFGRVEPEEIDAINIHQATLLAMQRAVSNLSIVPSKVLVDGAFIPSIAMPCEAIVKGDLLIFEIGAASILAKVARDSEMHAMDVLYPGYGFAKHKGYPTQEHRAALMRLGPCPIHRKSFAPVASLVLQKS